MLIFKSKRIEIFLLMPIFLFLFCGLPLYAQMAEDAERFSQVRNILYLCSLFSSLILFALICRKKFFHKISFVLVLLFFGITYFTLLASLLSSNNTGILLDIIALSSCWMAFIASCIFREIPKSKLLVLLGFTWLFLSYLISSKVNFDSLQAVYSEDSKFSGGYQIIGDTFSSVTCMLMGLLSPYLFNGKMKLHLMRFLLFLLFGSVSIGLLVINPSRSSLVAFVFSFIINLAVLLYMSGFKALLATIMCLMMTVFVLPIISFSSLDSAVMSNRNLSTLINPSENYDLGRDYLYDQGINQIITNPLFGNVNERTSEFGSGTYIHNILGVWQDVGIVPQFLLFAILIQIAWVICLKIKVKEINNLFWLSFIFSFSLFSVFFARYPFVFTPLFFCFGLFLSNSQVKKSTVCDGS
jgi:hypothetical protein